MIALNQLIALRSEYLAKYERKLIRINKKLGLGGIEKQIRAEDQHIKEIEERRISLEREWEFTYGKNDEFMVRQETIKDEMAEAFKRKKELEDEQINLRARKAELARLIDTIESLPERIEQFNDKTFLYTIDYVLVKPNALIYYFYGGEYIRVTLDDCRS